MRSVLKTVAAVVALLVSELNAFAQVQIMTADQIRNIESHLPRIEPGLVRDVIEDPTGIWYDLESMGVAYQIGTSISRDQEIGSTGRIGIANAMFNVSGEFPDNRKPNGFGGNLSAFDSGSFPWSPKPGGTAVSSNVESVKRLWLPKKADGSPWPIVVYPEELEGVFNSRATVTGLDWTAPIGTVYLELLFVNDTERQQHYLFEIRARIRMLNHWDVQLMRLYLNAQEVRQAVARLRPNWRESPQLVAFMAHLANESTVRPARLRDDTPGNPEFGTAKGDAFDVTAKIDVLPPIDSELVRELLTSSTLRKAVGEEWKPGCAAPTTNAAFHIVPQDYDGAFVGFDSIGCANCHRSTQISARRHDANNGKYGWNRGSKEGILSFHPFSLRALTPDVNANTEFRPAFVTAGVVENFDPAKHPKSMYLRLKGPIPRSKR